MYLYKCKDLSVMVKSENTKLTGNDTIPLRTWKTGFKQAVLNNNKKISCFSKRLRLAGSQWYHVIPGGLSVLW